MPVGRVRSLANYAWYFDDIFTGKPEESLISRRTSVFDFLERSLNFGLLDLRRVGVEAAEFLRLLPGQNAIGAGFVVFGRHVVLLHGRGVGVVRASARRAGIDDLWLVVWLALM